MTGMATALLLLVAMFLTSLVQDSLSGSNLRRKRVELIFLIAPPKYADLQNGVRLHSVVVESIYDCKIPCTAATARKSNRETNLGLILTGHSQKQTVLSEYILSRLCRFFFAKLRRRKETYNTQVCFDKQFVPL